MTTQYLMWEQYVEAAMLTASMGKGVELEGFVRVAGLCGEAGELFEALTVWQNAERPTDGHLVDFIAKELGDFLWYAAALGRWGNVTFDIGLHALQGTVSDLPYTHGDVMFHASKLAELMKKHLGHDKPWDADRFKQLMARCLTEAAVIAETVGLSLPAVCAINVAKLRARYQGGGFSSALAAKRLDETPSPA